MSNVRPERTIIDLRNVRTKEQKRIEHLRELARRQAEAAREGERTTSARAGWNDLVSGVLRVSSMVLVVAGAWSVFPGLASSLSYFTDTEAGNSHLASGLLDLTVSDPAAELVACGGMAVASTSIETDAMGFPTSVSASTTSLEGSLGLCEALDLAVRYDTATDSVTVYTGPAGGFAADELGEGQLRFIASLDGDAGPFPGDVSCIMNIDFRAWLASASGFEESGYRDRELTQVIFTVDADTCDECDKPCDNCGDLIVTVENDNDATVVNAFTAEADTGGNEGQGTTTIETGDASTSVSVVNEVNTNITNIISACGCTGECSCVDACDADPCAEAADDGQAPSSEEALPEETEPLVPAEEPPAQETSTSAESATDSVEDAIADIQDRLNDRLSRFR